MLRERRIYAGSRIRRRYKEAELFPIVNEWGGCGTNTNSTIKKSPRPVRIRAGGFLVWLF